MQRLLVEIDSAADDDAAQLEQLTQNLLGEIEELDIDSVELAPAAPGPHGSKAGPSFDWGTLLVTLADRGSVLVSVVTAIDDWLKNQGGRSVTVEIDGDRLQLTGASIDDQKALIEHWIERHRS